MRASAEQVRAALATSSGNVARAAVALGIARNNLYKRLAALGLTPDVYRAAAAASASPRQAVSRIQRPPRPLKVARSFHLRADLVRALDDACLDLPAILRQRVSPSQVLERFMDDGFSDWLARTLAQGRP